ncbi:hypothetical protein DID77_04510 [Candidatus Marinamargulisbacteria bacterium SCGC AG-439-L15]|nr:hypothetical protein DID77_04510 [Candidatus Marinamargulisbacteria bacterium SCGC AG-439-L15]
MNEQLDILIQMVDEDVPIIPSKFLKDVQVVGAFFNALSQNIILQISFMLKLGDSDIARLCSLDVIPEEALAHFFLHDMFPFPRIVEILRILPFESRKWILDQLKLKGFWRYNDIVNRIDAKYGRIEGVFFESVAVEKSEQETIDSLKQQILDTKSELEPIQQLVWSLSQKENQSLSIIDQVISSFSEYHINGPKKIETKSQFVVSLKLLCIISMTETYFSTYSKALDALLTQVFRTLLAYKDASSAVTIVEQLPKECVHRLLNWILKQCQSRDASVRQKCMSIKKTFESTSQDRKTSKIIKCIRRHDLGYNIPYLMKESVSK